MLIQIFIFYCYGKTDKTSSIHVVGVISEDLKGKISVVTVSKNLKEEYAKEKKFRLVTLDVNEKVIETKHFNAIYREGEIVVIGSSSTYETKSRHFAINFKKYKNVKYVRLLHGDKVLDTQEVENRKM